MKKSAVKKFLCTTFILIMTMQSSFAIQNYVTTTTTTESYSASSPIGTFDNYSSTGVVNPVYTTSFPAYNYYQPSIAISTPPVNVSYETPVYTAEVAYGTTPEASQNYSHQQIETPQTYNKTVSTTTEYVDTRETADKVIDRGTRILLPLAAVGAAVGLILGAL